MAHSIAPAQSPKDETTRLESLAQETDTSLNLVEAIYREEREALEQKATIRTFVNLIAMRRTRLIVQHLEGNAEPLDSH